MSILWSQETHLDLIVGIFWERSRQVIITVIIITHSTQDCQASIKYSNDHYHNHDYNLCISMLLYAHCFHFIKTCEISRKISILCTYLPCDEIQYNSTL